MSADSMVQAAIEYQKRGWKIIAVHGFVAGYCACGRADCKSPGKHPVDREWQVPRKLSSGDIYAIFDNDVVNIGILTGMPSGFFVLDIDPANGGIESKRRLEERFGRLPATYRVKTGSGGMHLYFAMPDFDLGNGRGSELRDYPGLDVRGTGGFVVAPPSVSGKGAYIHA